MAAKQAPVFNLPSQNGRADSKALLGQVVYIDFWASWCGPCRKSFPWMNEVQQRYQKLGFKVVAINLDKERSLAEEFLKEVPHEFTIGFDPEGKSAVDYDVKGMPSSYLIGRDGKIYHTHLGFRQEKTAEIEQQIKDLIKQ